MFVSRSMTSEVITITGDGSIFDAQEKMTRHTIRHLPVIDAENTLVGVVTDRDIRSALPYSLFKDPDCGSGREKVEALKIRDIMTKDPLAISPTDTIQDALLLIQEKRVGAFPVVDENRKLKGIISVRDLLRAFTNVLGLGEPGILLCILVTEEIGQLKKIVDAITEENISFGSILVAKYWEDDKRAVFPYLLTQNVSRVKKKLKDMGYHLLDPMDWYLDQLPKHK
ncbi:MAG: CBS domain-containing protein [Deltaproteobacteria bacterium]|nr:CBS domain-containing protein [Deltaproteobacteria bacterium]MBW2298171.1 CBS domain-containing protein [Deltaproteobacteria bacterium]